MQHLIPIVIDALHCDLACRAIGKRAAGGAVQLAPGGFVDVGLEGFLELVVRALGLR